MSNQSIKFTYTKQQLYAWLVVFILALANCVSYIDRLIISLLVQPIKADLNISDTQFSLLTGAAFAIFYCGMGLVIARWADRYSRKWIIIIGMITWCSMTSLASIARNFSQLFLFRIGVGVGEATLSPSAYSMLAGYFPPQRLALAIGIFSSGVTAGTGLAFLLGGATITWVLAQDTMTLPLLGTLSGWRLVMLIVGLLGLPIILLMLLVREPTRQNNINPATIFEVWIHYKQNIQKYGLLLIGYGTTSITAFSVMTWTPALYQRQYGASISEAAATIGTVALVGGLLGAFLGGIVADHLAQRGDPLAKLKVLFGCGVGLLVPSVIAPLMPTMNGHAAVIFFTFFFGTAATGPAASYIQTITPDRMRAQFGAVYQFALTFVGATLGPLAVALVTNYVYGDEQKLGYSMSTVSAIANPIAAWLLWRALQAERCQLATK